MSKAQLAPNTLKVADKYIPKKEFWIYAIGGLGQGMIYSMMSSYISDFYINVLQVPLLFVLLLMLIARFWDAIYDPFMGAIVDRYTTKWGKMKPYILFTAVPIAVLTYFMFFAPKGLSDTNKMIYAAVIYVLWGITYSISDVPFWSLPNAMTSNPSERATTISIGRTLNGVGAAVPMALFLLLGFVIPRVSSAQGIELDKIIYSLMAVVCSIVGIALFVNSYFHIKERVIVPDKKRDKSQPSAFSRIIKCKPLMLVILMGILSSGRYMMQAAAVHVARYAFYIGPNLQNLSEVARSAAIKGSVSTVSTIFSICSAVGMFGAMLFMPFLYKRFNYKQIVLCTCIAGFFASIITSVVGALSIFTTASYLVYVCIPFIIIQCIPLGALNITSYAMIGDSLDYLELKTGFRDNALGSACQSFVNQFGNAIATTFIVLMYIIININPSQMLNAEIVKAATDLLPRQRFAMFSLVSIVPGISLLLCAIPIFWYDLTGEKKDNITLELAEARQQRGINIE
ncbi:MAG TPA: glycoside-pentoside-hexuronide (GPH):cation symporter [Clostridia bacterium]|nr:glycoside-pentoside-hexuronide (GPH):cation symporter [Clostridia bacterium]